MKPLILDLAECIMTAVGFDEDPLIRISLETKNSQFSYGQNLSAEGNFPSKLAYEKNEEKGID